MADGDFILLVGKEDLGDTAAVVEEYLLWWTLAEFGVLIFLWTIVWAIIIQSIPLLPLFFIRISKHREDNRVEGQLFELLEFSCLIGIEIMSPHTSIGNMMSRVFSWIIFLISWLFLWVDFGIKGVRMEIFIVVFVGDIAFLF